MDTRIVFVFGLLCATTSGFNPHLLRRDDVAAQTAKGPDAVSVVRAGDQSRSCMLQASSCPSAKRMMDSLFSAHHGRMLIVNNHLKFSCSAESKAKLDDCASGVRRNCTGHTHWIDGLTGFYEDLCAMEQVLRENAACMNSPTVSRRLENCLLPPSGSTCEIIIQCLWIALNSDSTCSPELKIKFIAAITEFRNTQYGANCQRL